MCGVDAVAASDLIRELTPRQVQVLRLVADGLTRQEIADRLHLNVNTVRSLMVQVFMRLHAHNAAQAVAVAMRRGIIT